MRRKRGQKAETTVENAQPPDLGGEPVGPPHGPPKMGSFGGRSAGGKAGG